MPVCCFFGCVHDGRDLLAAVLNVSSSSLSPPALVRSAGRYRPKALLLALRAPVLLVTLASGTTTPELSGLLRFHPGADYILFLGKISGEAQR